MKNILKLTVSVMALVLPVCGFAQTYPNGLIDKTIAVVGNEMISLSQLEQEILYMRMQGMYSDKNMRCEQLERMMDSKLFLMQARIDSLSVNQPRWLPSSASSAARARPSSST